MKSSPSFTVEVKGLKELISSLASSNRLDALRPDIQSSLDELHSVLSKSIAEKFSLGRGGGITQIRKIKPLISSGNEITTGNVYVGERARNAAYYISRIVPGNIPPFPKQRPGRKVFVKITKKEKFLWGKHKFGGFLATRKGLVFERKSKDREDIIPVTSQGRGQMIENMIRSQKYLNAEKRILDKLTTRVLKNLYARTN